MILISALTMMVAESIARNPSNTESSFHFVASLASAFAGNTMMSPIHTIIPIEIKKVIVWILVTTQAISVIKSHPEFDTLRSGFDPDWMTLSGLQFLKLPRGFPSLYLHPEALANTATIEKSTNQRKIRIFFIELSYRKTGNKRYYKPSKGNQGKSYHDIPERFHRCRYFFYVSRSPQELSTYPDDVDNRYDSYECKNPELHCLRDRYVADIA
jgi:hypothetical protein